MDSSEKSLALALAYAELLSHNKELEVMYRQLEQEAIPLRRRYAKARHKAALSHLAQNYMQSRKIGAWELPSVAVFMTRNYSANNSKIATDLKDKFLYARAYWLKDDENITLRVRLVRSRKMICRRQRKLPLDVTVYQLEEELNHLTHDMLLRQARRWASLPFTAEDQVDIDCFYAHKDKMQKVYQKMKITSSSASRLLLKAVHLQKKEAFEKLLLDAVEKNWVSMNPKLEVFEGDIHISEHAGVKTLYVNGPYTLQPQTLIMRFEKNGDFPSRALKRVLSWQPRGYVKDHLEAKGLLPSC